MAIDSVSALSPITAYGQRAQASRPAETPQESQLAENARGTALTSAARAAQTSAPGTSQAENAPGTSQTENAPGTSQIQASTAQRNGSPGNTPRPELSGPETGGNWNWAVAQPGVSASPSETEGSIQSASTQIAKAYGSGQTSSADIRNASEAYRNEASARDQAAQQQQGGGTRTLDIFA
jgi:hypothetical protein